MTILFDRGHLSRRAVLRRLAGAIAAGLTVSQAFAEDDTLTLEDIIPGFSLPVREVLA